MKVLVDSNVVLRAAQAGHPQYPIARAALAALIERGDELCVFPQVHHEVWVVATRPVAQNGLGLTIEAASTLLAGLRRTLTLLDDQPGLVDRWQELVVKHECKGKCAHDTRLVAGMMLHGVDHLLTFNDADFRRYPGLTVLVPHDVAGWSTAQKSSG